MTSRDAERARAPAFPMGADGKPLTPPGYMLLTNAEYRRLLIGIEADDTLIICETCGAWIDHNDPACAEVEDYRGCWKIASGRPADEEFCRSWRAPDRQPCATDSKPCADLARPIADARPSSRETR